MWASHSSHKMAIAWPKATHSLSYLSRPWCVTELLIGAERQVHCIYSQEETAMSGVQ